MPRKAWKSLPRRVFIQDPLKVPETLRAMGAAGADVVDVGDGDVPVGRRAKLWFRLRQFVRGVMILF